MPRSPSLKPSYCLDETSGRADVTVDGRRTYLGADGTQARCDLYDRLRAAGMELRPPRRRDAAALTFSGAIAGTSGLAPEAPLI